MERMNVLARVKGYFCFSYVFYHVYFGLLYEQEKRIAVSNFICVRTSVRLFLTDVLSVLMMIK